MDPHARTSGVGVGGGVGEGVGAGVGGVGTGVGGVGGGVGLGVGLGVGVHLSLVQVDVVALETQSLLAQVLIARVSQVLRDLHHTLV
jgi:hypothetical protein